MTITLNFTNLYNVVARTLSIVGKRSTDDKGNRIFTDITLGTNEKEIISDYFRQAVIDLSAETAAFITASSDTTNQTITLTFPTNHNSQLETFIQKSCEAYCVSFALYAWLNIVAPRIAERYSDDCKRQLAAVMRLVYDKKPPVSAVSFSNPTGAVTTGNEVQTSTDEDEPNPSDIETT